MTTAKFAPRHRKARRPLAPISDFTDALSTFTLSPARGTAVASVTGLAFTAVVGAVANAAPIPLSDAPQAAPAARVTDLPTTVSVPDIAWGDDETVTASAAAPAPEETAEAEAPADEDTQAASRDEARADITGGQAAPVAVPANGSGSSIVSIAMSLLGIPYVYGGTSPAGFDCSGFTQYVYAQAGISIPRTSGEQGYAGTFIPASEAQPGDLVWHAYGHVGIYAGNGMVIEATTPGSVTKIQALWGDYQFVRY